MTLHERLEELFGAVLNDDELRLDDDTAPAELPGWDSLVHVNAMFAVEEAFGVQFADDEFARVRTVGGLKELLRAKGAAT